MSQRNSIISIITCTYNSEKYLKDCINSVIAQGLNINDYEHIFVDANSGDSTENIINDYKKTYSNVKIIKKEPKGVYNAMNEGIKNSDGKYLLFLNSDDFLEENILNNYINFVEKYDADIFYGKLYLYKDKEKISGSTFMRLRQFLGFLGFHCLFQHPTMLIKREVFNEIGYYDEHYKIASDFGLWLKCLKNHKSFKYFPFFVSNFRVHSGSISSNNKKISKKEMSEIRKNVFGIHGKVQNFIGNIVYLFTGQYL